MLGGTKSKKIGAYYSFAYYQVVIKLKHECLSNWVLVAQLVERWFSKLEVHGSILSLGKLVSNFFFQPTGAGSEIFFLSSMCNAHCTEPKVA